MFHGSIVAIVTPCIWMEESISDSLRRLLDWHIKNSTDAIVIWGVRANQPPLILTNEPRLSSTPSMKSVVECQLL